MLLLAATTDKLQLVSGAAATLDVVASFMDHTTLTDDVVGDRQVTPITTATTTDIVAVPGSGVVRNVKELTVRNRHASQACDVTVVYDANGTDYEIHKATLLPGQTLMYAEGVGWVILTGAVFEELIKVLAADETGANSSSAQPWFPANGGVTVEADTTYRFMGALHLTRAAGTTSHTTGFGFGGTATLTAITWWAHVGEGDVATPADSDIIVSQTAANTNVKAASTGATEVIKGIVDGIVRVNAAGTFIPQFTYSSAPGGVPTVKIGSFFRLERLGPGGFASQGVWA